MHCAQLNGKHSANQTGAQLAYALTMPADSFRHSVRRSNLELVLGMPLVGGPTNLARLLGRPKMKAHLSNARSGKRGIGDDLAAAIELAADLPRGWMDQQHPVAGEPAQSYAVAQLSSHQPSFDDLPLLKWENIKMGNVPDTFRAVLPDNALAPNYPAGSEIVWTLKRRAAPGRVVLIRDAHGALHARVCRQGKAPGQWLAAPYHADFATFDSATDRIELVAVFKGLLEPDD